MVQLILEELNVWKGVWEIVITYTSKCDRCADICANCTLRIDNSRHDRFCSGVHILNSVTHS